MSSKKSYACGKIFRLGGRDDSDDRNAVTGLLFVDESDEETPIIDEEDEDVIETAIHEGAETVIIASDEQPEQENWNLISSIQDESEYKKFKPNNPEWKKLGAKDTVEMKEILH